MQRQQAHGKPVAYCLVADLVKLHDPPETYLYLKEKSFLYCLNNLIAFRISLMHRFQRENLKRACIEALMMIHQGLSL